MKHLFAATILATALGATTGASAGEITVVSWGGAYTKSQVEAYQKPWMAATGNKINSVDSDNPAGPIKAQVEAGNVTYDVIDVEYSDALRFCDEGLLEPIDPASISAGADGTPATADFVAGAITDCAVASIAWSTIYAYDNTKFSGDQPATITDFFDTAKFPGKRGLKKNAKATLEMALMGDGVTADKVYEVLATPEGVAQAFKKLDSIKGDIVWWEAGAQPPQLLADGEVAMTMAYNGRIFSAAVDENKPFNIVWDGQILDFDLFAVPKGAPNKKLAMDFIVFATGTQPLADQAKWISYGPARKSSALLVGKYKDGKTDMAPHMPTAPEHLKNYIVNSSEFWANHDTELNEKFNVWLATN
jgi:putative spermidine/putrescine transport system substrate-binding protein